MPTALPDSLFAPGEVARPPVLLAPGASYTNAPDARETAAVFAPGHTISDVVRYAIACADVEEVRSILDMMGDSDAPYPL